MKPYISLVLITGSIGLYQTPQADTFLNKHDVNINLSQTLPYGHVLQSSVENFKIGITSPSNTSTAHVDISPVAKVSLSTNGGSSLKSTAEEAPAVSDKCTENCLVVMLGDSMMGEVARSYKRLIKKEHPTWKVIDLHKSSTGLCNNAYYDWPVISKQIIESKKPDYVYILIGMNDAQNMVVDKGYLFGKDTWRAEYKKRVDVMTSLMNQSFISDWKWVQLPVVSSDGFNSKLEVIRAIQKENIPVEHYVEIESLLGSNGDNKKVDSKTRASDGIHLNTRSGDLVAQKLIAYNQISKELTTHN